MKIVTAAALSLSLLAAAPAIGQTAAPSDWRTVAPENLLVIDTAKGRILVELEPRMAPQAVARVRTLADQGFYDGLKFHRVITSGFSTWPFCASFPDLMARTASIPATTRPNGV